MQTKHFFLSLLVLLTWISVSLAQESPGKAPIASDRASQPQTRQVAVDSKLYAKIYGGFGMLTPGSYKLTSLSGSNYSAVSSFSIGSKAFGGGLHFGGGIGYIINDFINIGLDAEYLKGSKLQASTNFQQSASVNTFYFSTVDYSILSLVPNITFKALSTPTYFIYTRIGILLTVNKKFSLSAIDSVIQPVEPMTSDSITTFKNNLSAGVQLALGVQVKITDKIRGFGELVGNYLPMSPSSATISGTTTFYPSPGSAVKPTVTPITPYDRSYVTSGTLGNTQQPKLTYNVNYIGINIGVVYRF